MARSVLITGGAGFIGSNLVKAFNKASPRTTVVVLDDLSSGQRENLDESACEFIEGSILDSALVERTCEKVDSIIHLAAIGSVPRSVENPRRTNEINVTGSLNVFEAARLAQIRHLIVASSSSVYGSSAEFPKSESNPTFPKSPYAASKLATESYALAYQECFGLRTLAFRFFNVFGPGQRADHDYAAVIPKFLAAALTGGVIQIHGSGHQTRDFTFVKSVCEIILQAWSQGTSHDIPVNLAYGSRTSILELVREIETLTNKNLPKEFTPGRPGDVFASQADATSLKKLFQQSERPSIHDGLRETLEWLEDRV